MESRGVWPSWRPPKFFAHTRRPGLCLKLHALYLWQDLVVDRQDIKHWAPKLVAKQKAFDVIYTINLQS